ncbi:hypothetical protein [Fibrobacter sp.]|uniref:hypothetical protein n=1 Tax=Fibrobacter sp. TaxID=35828 RepID=UPI00388E89F4
MLLLKTSINLRSDLSWSMVYSDCIYPWLDGSVDKKGRKNYQALLNKLLPSMNIKKEESKRVVADEDSLEYHSFELDGCAYLCFIHNTNGNGFSWRTKIALKKDDKHLFCFVSLECEATGASSFPKISKPKIIDYLIKFQAGDGDVEFKRDAHILAASEIEDAKNILLGKKKNRLPIIYLSCAGRSHAIKPSELASALFGLAHVYAEKDRFLSDRIKQDVEIRIPQRGSIGLCYPGKPIVIINRNGANAKDFVWEIYFAILKSSLSANFDFSWNNFIDAENRYKKIKAENEKQIALAKQQKEKKAAENEAKKTQEKFEKNAFTKALDDKNLDQRIKKIQGNIRWFKKIHEAVYNDFKTAYIKNKELCDTISDQQKKIAELNEEIANLNADNVRLTEQNRSLENDVGTYESWVQEEEKKNKDLTEHISDLESTNENLRMGLESQKKQGGNHIPLIMPEEEEMYENEYVCQLINLFKRAVDILPRAKNTNIQRSIDVFVSILNANPDAVKIFEQKNREKEVLESYARKAELQKPKGIKAMKPFNMECGSKENNHGEPRFVKDKNERYSATEASTPSDKKRGSINGGKDTIKALLWS